MPFVSPNNAGLVAALLLGGWHLLWALLVAMGWAQAIIDFIFWMHLLKPVLVVEPFSLARAGTLVLVTGGLGYLGGAAAAVLWNACHRQDVS